MTWDSLFFLFLLDIQKRRDILKKGRPALENPRKEGYRLRMNSEESKKLINICKSTGMTKADALRTAIEDLYLKECGGRING